MIAYAGYVINCCHELYCLNSKLSRTMSQVLLDYLKNTGSIPSLLGSENYLLYNDDVDLSNVCLVAMKEFSYKLVKNDSDLESALEVRKEVFVKQQGIPENLVFDGLDTEAMHMVVTKGGQTIGTARIRFLDTGEAKLERMAVLKAFRDSGIGKGIISFVVEELTSRRVEKLVLHAQHEVVGFYNKCGFEEAGSPFWEAGIKHIKMERCF